MDDLAKTFRALSDATRLDMLALLMERGEVCVCEFVEALAISQSKASRHLRYLLNARLVRDRREGAWVHYRLNDETTPREAAILAALAGAITKGRRRELAKHLSSRRAGTAAGLCEPAPGPGRRAAPRPKRAAR